MVEYVCKAGDIISRNPRSQKWWLYKRKNSSVIHLSKNYQSNILIIMTASDGKRVATPF
jgi:hypothetical protein